MSVIIKSLTLACAVYALLVAPLHAQTVLTDRAFIPLVTQSEPAGLVGCTLRGEVYLPTVVGPKRVKVYQRPQFRSRIRKLTARARVTELSTPVAEKVSADSWRSNGV